ncbi:hypothetical protein [Arthrobacter oryzae]|uniref:hypothetical protein n=1 Tax=Arthrobacter oryzae TaxID=409290 RepID=UPI0027D8ED85|nr:hypothetical protein [Arthrobacter oryzae]
MGTSTVMSTAPPSPNQLYRRRGRSRTCRRPSEKSTVVCSATRASSARAAVRGCTLTTVSLRLPATTKMSARTDTSTTTAMGWGVY